LILPFPIGRSSNSFDKAPSDGEAWGDMAENDKRSKRCRFNGRTQPEPSKNARGQENARNEGKSTLTLSGEKIEL
jgi:hypothetical protein